GSRRIIAATRYSFASGPRRVAVNSREIGLFEVGIIVQNLLLSHPGGEHIENVPHRYPEPTDTGFLRALARYYSVAGTVSLGVYGHGVYYCAGRRCEIEIDYYGHRCAPCRMRTT